jgi:ankyrin repeat protein
VRGTSIKNKKEPKIILEISVSENFRRLFQKGNTQLHMQSTLKYVGKTMEPPSSLLREAFLIGMVVFKEELEGIDIDLPDETARTMLSISGREGHLKHVRMLLEMGSNPNQRRPNGETPTITSTRQGHLDVVRTLVEFGADVNHVMVEGWTALLISAAKGHVHVAKYLIEAGADVNAELEEGATALLIAAAKGFTDMVDLLVEHGADVNSAMNGGATPLLVAAQSNHPATCLSLILSGADMDLAMDNGGRPLYISAQNGHMETVMMLVECGANVDALTPVAAGSEDGFKAEAIAERRGHHEVAYLLKEVSAFKTECKTMTAREILNSMRAPVMQWVPGMDTTALRVGLDKIKADEEACYAAFFHGEQEGGVGIQRLSEYEGPISELLVQYLVLPASERDRRRFLRCALDAPQVFGRWDVPCRML